MKGEELRNYDDEDEDDNLNRMDQSVLNDDYREVHGRLQMEELVAIDEPDSMKESSVQVENMPEKSRNQKPSRSEVYEFLYDERMDDNTRTVVAHNVTKMMESLNSARNLLDSGLKSEGEINVDDNDDDEYFYDVFGEDQEWIIITIILIIIISARYDLYSLLFIFMIILFDQCYQDTSLIYKYDHPLMM